MEIITSSNTSNIQLPLLILLEAKSIFVCPTEDLLFIMQLSLSALGSKNEKISVFKYWGRGGSCSDLTVF